MNLGLDISTTTIGYNIIDKQNNIIKLGFIKPNNYLNKLSGQSPDMLFNKCLYSIEKIKELLFNYPITKISIEDSLKNFATGKTKADVKIMLITINSYIYFELLKLKKYKIKKIHPLTARKKVIGKMTKELKEHFSEPKSKRIAMYFLIKKYGKSFYNQLPKMKTKDKLCNEAFDISDSLIISLSCQ